jgi:hypothetical protein
MRCDVRRILARRASPALAYSRSQIASAFAECEKFIALFASAAAAWSLAAYAQKSSQFSRTAARHSGSAVTNHGEGDARAHVI